MLPPIPLKSPPPMVCVYCGILSPPILISEVLPPAHIVYMVVVDEFTKGGGLISSSGGMMNVILLGLV